MMQMPKEKQYTKLITEKHWSGGVSGYIMFEGDKLREFNCMAPSDVDMMLSLLNGAWSCGWSTGYVSGTMEKNDEN